MPRWVRLRQGDFDQNGSAADGVRISRTIIQDVMQSQKPLLSIDAANDVRFISPAAAWCRFPSGR